MSLFGFDDDEIKRLPTRKSAARIVPPAPDTGWRPPTFWPNLSAAAAISVDVETKETDFDHGPGWARNQGHIVGIGIGAVDQLGNVGKWYFPIRHEVDTHFNMPVESVIAYARDVCATPIPKVGANITYDVGWLAEENIRLNGEIHDVQFAETLITFDGPVDLDYLGEKYIKRGKGSDLMYRWQAEAYGGSLNGKQRANIYRTSPLLVGPYGEDDVDLPIRVYEKQNELIWRMGLRDVYRMECDLIPLMVQMRREGVRIDVAYAERLYGELTRDLARVQALFEHEYGVCNVESAREIASVFDRIGIKYKRTAATRTNPNGSPSFTKEFLKGLDHPIGEQILELRMLGKIKSTFVGSYLLQRHVNGRLHGTFSQMRDDDNGARSGRFSSQDPNLQNLPIRPGVTEEKLVDKKSPHYDPAYVPIGQRVRRAFVPELGHIAWEKNDLSQIQYRFLAHFAVGQGSNELRQKYNDNPKTDYHDVTHDIVFNASGLDIPRRPIKNINFGLVFGMGRPKLIRSTGMDPKQGKITFDTYHSSLPFVSATMGRYSNMVLETGEVRTILGRIARFDKWEPLNTFGEERQIALPYDQAVMVYGMKIQRAYAHKGLNYGLQGSEGDYFKKAMWLMLKSGVFTLTGVPKLIVHDEKNFSVPDDSPEMNQAFDFVHRTMETAIPLRVPVYVETKRAATWGHID